MCIVLAGRRCRDKPLTIDYDNQHIDFVLSVVTTFQSEQPQVPHRTTNGTLDAPNVSARRGTGAIARAAFAERTKERV